MSAIVSQGADGLSPVRQQCAAQIADVAAAGAELILFHPLFAPGEQAARIAGEVIPLVS